MSEDFVAVARTGQLPEGGTLRVRVDERPVLLARVEGEIYACDDTCTHEDSSLYLGCLKGALISCTLHGSRFDVRTGEPQEPPATEPLATYAVRIEGDRILVSRTPRARD
ncbi:MAG: non-heme iron oxygenase ferredoxin subunit [Gammaproteobacteria bacterium]|nr:MAG: non-heme iron oxygenase ferredoxin subunit [Gammaproteobacteria bacterium]